MHDDRDLVERRIERDLWERVLPLVHREQLPLTIAAGPDLEHLEPFEVGSEWGPPWATTYFSFDGDVPAEWPHRSGTHLAVVIDLGFTRAPAGFQCEGLVIASRQVDGIDVSIPVQGLHPRRTEFTLPPTPGPFTIVVEAASNPSFPQFRPSPDGSLDTAGTDPRYRFRRADLVLVEEMAAALVHDIDVLDGLMRALPLTDPRRPRLLRTIATALDQIPDVVAARRTLAPELVGRSAGSSDDATRHRIVATGHAHIDTAWLWPIRETQRKCARTFASAVRLMDEYPDFKFSVSQAQQYAWIEAQHPELFEAIRERVDRGQWLPVGGMWVEADMNLPSGESLARQIVFGQRYFTEKFGRPCTEVWIPDVFGYPAGLPQLFAAGGMSRFVTQKLSWNKQNRFPHHTFWWEGLDGTRVLTHFPPVDTYNAEITPAEVAMSVDNFREHAWSGASLMPFGYGDGGGGPTAEMLERARRLADIDPRTTLEIGTADDFFTQVEREATLGAPIPVWRGELYFEMHRGTLTSQLRTKVGNRRCERLLVEAEMWAATIGEPTDGLDDLWREVLTQQFHDILPGASIAWVHADAEEVFARVAADLEARIETSLGEIVERRSSPPDSTGAATYWVANPADAPVDGVVVLPAAPDGAVGQHLADGEVATSVRVRAFGIARVEPRSVADRVVLSDSSMSNGRLAVRWDRAGNITSMIDIDRRRELVPVGASIAALELAPDHPVEYDAWDIESWTRHLARPVVGRAGAQTEVTIDDAGPLVGRVSARTEFGPSSVAVTYELRAGCAQLYVHVDLDWHHDEHLLTMAFPFDVRTDSASCDVQFGVVNRPTHPSSPWDAAKFEVCAHRFVDLSEPDFGVAVLNDGRYGHGVFDGAIRVSLARAAKYPDPTADHGRHRVTLAVRPHDAGLADVRAAASRLNAPLRLIARPHRVGVEAGGGVGVDGPHTEQLRPVIDVHGAGVEIDAVKLADDGSGDLVVRLHEACGNRVQTSMRAAQRIGQAWRCDLLEVPIIGEEVTDGIVAMPLHPFELVTMRLRLADDFNGR